MNPAETSPLALYTWLRCRVQGILNAARTSTPDPAVMARRSILSAVSEQIKRLLN